MRNLAFIGLVASLFSGCIIYEEELIDDTGDTNGDGRPDRPDDTSQDTDIPDDTESDIHLWLNPAGATPGSVNILSLYTDSDVDLTTVDQVRFFGDGNVQVLATDTRGPNEFLLTISVPSTASAANNDMLVEFADGTAVFVEGAFSVVATAGEIPPSEGVPSSGDTSNCP